MTHHVVVIGMGYVGIPAAALFADVEGFKVIGVQRRSQRSGWKIDHLNEGKNPIGGEEPGLASLIHRVVNEKKSFSVTDDVSVVKDADSILIDVQTPTDEKGIPHYESLREVCAQVAKHMRKGALVVIESTVAPGTTEHIAKPILEENSGMKAGEDFFLAFAYERVMVGRLIYNIQNYPRIIGGINQQSTDKAFWLYDHIVRAKLFKTDSLTAEIAKVVENTYRDVNIAFANEVAVICESLGADVYEVRKMVNSLPNHSHDVKSNPHRNMHVPGAGVGGHCLPKDPWLLKWGLDNYGKFEFDPEVIVRSRLINDFMPVHLAGLAEAALKAKGVDIKGAKIAVLGYAFLEDSDDTRNTPALPFVRALEEKGATVATHDPLVRQEESEVPISRDLDEVIKGADCVALVTKHKEYFDLDLAKLKEMMRTPVFVDGRNVYPREDIEAAGFEFRGIGKGC